VANKIIIWHVDDLKISHKDN